MNACAQCFAPLTERRLTSRALQAAFCSEACYAITWKDRMPKYEARGGLPAVQDDLDYEDMCGTGELKEPVFEEGGKDAKPWNKPANGEQT